MSTNSKSPAETGPIDREIAARLLAETKQFLTKARPHPANKISEKTNVCRWLHIVSKNDADGDLLAALRTRLYASTRRTLEAVVKTKRDNALYTNVRDQVIVAAARCGADAALNVLFDLNELFDVEAVAAAAAAFASAASELASASVAPAAAPASPAAPPL